eukprot:m.121636 g.121636  ORF g.121636 m.121636 type:complete len:62 (-) comp15527_c0_seq2:123-308(-)
MRRKAGCMGNRTEEKAYFQLITPKCTLNNANKAQIDSEEFFCLSLCIFLFKHLSWDNIACP